MPALSCPLCKAPSTSEFARVQEREYFRCACCDLIFMHPRCHPSAKSERERYLHHQNDSADPAYRDYLLSCLQPALNVLPAGASCLDYGCGPSKTAEALLREHGFPAESYDLHFHPDQTVLASSYDFIFCCETAEHFRDPHAEFSRLASLLNPSGLLLVVTQLLTSEIDFASWWYVRDFTHLCFYSSVTFKWLAQNWRLTLIECRETGVLLRRTK